MLKAVALPWEDLHSGKRGIVGRGAECGALAALIRPTYLISRTNLSGDNFAGPNRV